MSTRRHHGGYQRRVTRLIPRLTAIGATLAGLFVLLMFLRAFMGSPPYRQAILLAGDPYLIASFTADRKRVTVAEIPADMIIPSVMGYGEYGIASLDRLDKLDRKNGTLISQSVSDAFGVPVMGYVRSTEATGDPQARIRRTFSWKSIADRLVGKTDTSVSLPDWIAYVWAVRTLPGDALERADLGTAGSTVTLPDGSRAVRLDESKLDYLFAQTFMDGGIRSEGYSVALYNTTDIPSVAQRASRVMTHSGIQLVFVGNAPSDSDACILHGETSVLRSKTAAFLRAYFRCANAADGNKTLGTETGADIVIGLGKRYASLYTKK